MTDDDYHQPESEMFWAIVAFVFFGLTGFVAGVLYPFFM